VDRDLTGRPVDLPDGIAKRERSDRPGESILSAVQMHRTTRTSVAEAATERSEGVAGAERSHAPANFPQGEPSIRAKRVVGETRRAEIDCVRYAEYIQLK